jgi:hypothetical protein
MIPTTHGILQQKPVVASALIEVDVTYLFAAYIRYAYSEYCNINVTPNTIATTITRIDTGDGITWATISPISGTGDYAFRARTASNNSTAYDRIMTLRITDNAGIAPSVDVIFTQTAQYAT